MTIWKMEVRADGSSITFNGCKEYFDSCKQEWINYKNGSSTQKILEVSAHDSDNREFNCVFDIETITAILIFE